MLLAGFLLFGAGCRSTELLESELRTREVQYEQLAADFGRLRHEHHALQTEIVSLRQGQALPPESAGPTCGLKRIAISRLSGGVDLNHATGDDGLYLIVEPFDAHDHIIKVPGSLQVTALEINFQGIKTPLCSWELPPERLVGCWQHGIFSAGYTVTLPWTNWPASENLRIVVKFILLDGRVFEADRDIRIVLSPAADQLPRPLPGEQPPLLEEGLPAPLPLPPTTDLDAAAPASFSMHSRPRLRRPQPLIAE